MNLTDLGWRQFFVQQLSIEALEMTPARIVHVARSQVDTLSEAGRLSVELPLAWQRLDAQDRPTIGDWILLDDSNELADRLERFSLFKRKAAGERAEIQLIGANIDTLFVVSSCNVDFNPSRIERYLALALDNEVDPVVVLTKADLAASEAYVETAQALRPGLDVIALDATRSSVVDALAPWCRSGQTVALVGSSGVGKSTLVNSLLGQAVQATGAIREDDAKGRHTTTARSLHLLPGGGMVLDSPGMRELKLADVRDGIDALFDDIDTIARGCRFNDCGHDTEPGCAVQAALAAGQIDERRFANFQKLLREEAHNSMTLHERHQKFRAWGKATKAQLKATDKRKR
ncbi:MAG: ribosome small subunit-dependent GTPase A [Pseudomonadota bacterium]